MPYQIDTVARAQGSLPLFSFSEVILSVEVDRKEVMARCLLDTGCTKSMDDSQEIDR